MKLDIVGVTPIASSSVMVTGGNDEEHKSLEKLLKQAYQTKQKVHVHLVNLAHTSPAETQRFHIDCIIFNLTFAQEDQLHHLETLRKNYLDVPIVAILNRYDATMAASVLRAGAQECLTQQEVSAELLSMMIANARKRLDSELELKQALNEAEKRSAQLEQIANHDFLTRIPNRAYFDAVITRSLYNAMQTGKSVALLYLDLNDFKYVNDSFGHDVGDTLLKLVAERLNKYCRSTDFVARLGGDEFVILTEQMEFRSEVFCLVDRLVKGFDTPFAIGSHQLTCKPSIGVAYYPDGQTPDVLLQQADAAMYEAKSKPNLPVCFYTRKMRHQFSRTIQIRAQLNEAIDKNEFDVHFQKVIDNHDQEHLIFEALLRWESLFLGDVTPKEFIPIIDGKEQANRLTHLVLTQSAKLIHSLPKDKKITIKVNITPSQIRSLTYINQLLSQIETLKIPPNAICLEINAADLEKSYKRCRSNFELIKEAGLQLSLDEFGVNCSSLNQLINIPIDMLNFDRGIVASLEHDLPQQALMSGVIETAHKLGIKVGIEGIEQEVEHHIAKNMGCDFQQGYFYSHPCAMGNIL